MSVADKDGRIAQALRDRMVCLSIGISESLIESFERFETVLAELRSDAEHPDADQG